MAENILLKIKENLKNFSLAEKRIAIYVLNNQTNVLKMSIKELADACETSQATVVRFSRTVGATGFSDFKIRLSALQNLDKSLLEEISPDENLSTVKEKLTVRIQQSLSDTNKTLNDNTINEVVNLIDQSKSISVYGMGPSFLAALNFAQKFGQLGLSPFIGDNVNEIIAHVINQEVPGLFIIISNSGERPLLKNLLKSIPQEIKIVVLTKTPKSSLAKSADYVLNYSATSFPNRMRTFETTSLLAQLYSIDLLYYRYFQNNFEKHFFQIQNSSEKTHGFRKK